MGKKVTLGGDRLGSGKRMKQELHNFYRSNHNLSSSIALTMAPGILYPFYCIPATNGETFDIDLDAFVRTIPTKGPLFGSFKLQVDFFSVPVRLYQGILHNNPLSIGLKMNQVKLPKLKVETAWEKEIMATAIEDGTFFEKQVHPSSLLKFSGISGVGAPQSTPIQDKINFSRKVNAVPILAYYDIFKNYYANKQEENAYVITPHTAESPQYDVFTMEADGTKSTFTYGAGTRTKRASISFIPKSRRTIITIKGQDLKADWQSIRINFNGTTDNLEDIGVDILTDNLLTFTIDNEIEWEDQTGVSITAYAPIEQKVIGDVDTIKLTPFKLSNIDEMRTTLLSMNQLGEEYVINDFQRLPYSTMCETDTQGYNLNRYPLNGLVVKTYQSDMFNNWLDTEWIEGENGINQISAVSVTDGKFTIDTLNLANKVYDMLNRIAISGGTYQDWQDAVYTGNTTKHCETPIYIGGMSSEVMFDEVISTAETTVDGETQALGTLGGRGKLQGRKGGKIVAKIKEPSFIMGIVSLTPRIMYSQGNQFHMTEFDTVDDFHKPNLDGIGFQDLLVSKMNFTGDKFNENGTQPVSRLSAGKQTAWIDWMTDVDRCNGDFALTEGKSFMVLGRNYSPFNDITTYIEPTKFNYAFAYTELDAQNFWTFINVENKARRLMSAKQIPNL